MSEINLIKSKIIEEIEKENPSSQNILPHLLSVDLLEQGLEYDPKDEWKYLSKTEFFDFFGDTFKANPEFYMKNLYEDVKSL